MPTCINNLLAYFILAGSTVSQPVGFFDFLKVNIHVLCLFLI